MYRIRKGKVTDSYIVEYFSKNHNSWVYLHGGFPSFGKAQAWLESQLLDKTMSKFRDFD